MLSESQETIKPLKIFHLEDDIEEFEIVNQILRKGKILAEMKRFSKSEDLLQSLNKGDIPDLLILDLNLPGMDGREVLSIIRKDPKLHDLFIIILTTSKSENDILLTYKHGSNVYIPKPMTVLQLITALNTREDVWIQPVKVTKS